MLLKRNLVDKCKETIMVLYKSGQTSFGILHSSLELSETYRSEVLLIYLSVPTVWDFSPLDGAFSHTSHSMECMP